ncbi:hypothetical protein [Aquimarina spongiae]|nr:hypothetical protein [Aquimarina spongiae]
MDPIVGVWRIEKTVHVFKDGNTEIEYPSECFKNSRYEYKSDGSLIFKRTEGEKLEECINRPKDFWTGKWKKVNEKTYQMDYRVMFSDKSISNYSNKTNTFSFSNNNNTLNIYDDYSKSETSFVKSPEGVIVADYSVYKRVK